MRYRHVFLPPDSGATLNLLLKMLTLWYKRLHYYGKSPCLMGKIHYFNGNF